MAARYEHFQYNNKEIRIVIVGKTGAGKSASANTILGKKAFQSKFSSGSVTEKCGRADCELDGQKVSVIDTPGLFDTEVDEKTTSRSIIQCMAYASPGPHIFLIIIKLGRFTGEEKKTVQMIQKIFGEEADKYSMVLFTHGDLLDGTTIEQFLSESKDLQELVDKCNGQYHVFDNKSGDQSQVTELLNKIRNITEKNGGSHYTTEMLQKAERAIKEETERILKAEAEKMHREIEEEKRKLEKEYEQRIREAEDKKERELRAELKRKQEKRRAELLKQYEMKARREAEESDRVIKAIAVIVGLSVGIAMAGAGVVVAAGAAGAVGAIGAGVVARAGAVGAAARAAEEAAATVAGAAARAAVAGAAEAAAATIKAAAGAAGAAGVAAAAGVIGAVGVAGVAGSEGAAEAAAANAAATAASNCSIP